MAVALEKNNKVYPKGCTEVLAGIVRHAAFDR